MSHLYTTREADAFNKGSRRNNVVRLREEAEVVERGGEGAGLDAVDDLYDLVVHRSGATDLAAVGADGTVDGIDLGFLAALKILKHTGFQTGVLADGYRDDHKGG